MRRPRRLIAGLAVAAGFGAAAAVTAATGPTGTTTALPRIATAVPQAAAVVRLPPAVRRRRARERRVGIAVTRAILRRMPYVTAGGPRRKLIALSFDDGPGPFTRPLLHELIALHVPATFFVVGQQLSTFAGLLRTELLHGEAIGDHTENHRWLIALSPAAQREQIDTVLTRLHGLGAPAPLLFRPPYGAFNAETLRAARRLGLLTVLWDVDTKDWARPGVDRIVYVALSGARPGAIELMHDGGGDRSETVAALPRIVRGLRRRGYRLVTIPTLLAADPPRTRQRFGATEGLASPHATRPLHRSRTP